MVMLLDRLIDGIIANYIAGNLAGLNGLTNDSVSVPAPHGNSGGSSVGRLREGIERFLITDINNPAASAQAQSNVWVMCDMLSTRAQEYNHIPGGTNVLYMDGHVEFRRYAPEDKAPANRYVAGLTRGLTRGNS
jgi:prepilin-type processing-associated H-X9-DG protein